MRRNLQEANGFESWGGYMEMKKQKLQEQFFKDAAGCLNPKDGLFKGISVFVNGYTDPTADEIRNIMMEHGGIYHHYYRSGKTTYVIASNLPDSKMKLTQGIKFLKPSWIVDCVKEKKIFDYCDYLLYTNQSKTQPSIVSLLSPSKAEIKKSSITKTASDKEFLSEFYSNSRLHHISTMGSIFKQYINDLRLAKDHLFHGRDELKALSGSTVDQHIISVSKIVMHIDMDCFFVSVGIRNKPKLKGTPIAVTHAKGNRSHPSGGLEKEKEACQSRGIKAFSTLNEMDSMSEIASCSYEARAVGVKNGMFLGQALKLCPNLKAIDYDFDSYKEVSFSLYNTISRYTLDIEAVSCDEMYVDCTELLQNVHISPLHFAKILREEIKKITNCPCSVGFGENRLQARIATKKAKPDGVFYLQEDPQTFFYNIPVSDLPGVGYSTTYKLKSNGIKTCGDLQVLTVDKLQQDFGNKLGDTLYKYCRGIDDKDLVFNQVRKSVSADVNYGIRFKCDTERDIFLKQLSEEVSQRIQAIKMKAKCLTLKLMVRSEKAPEETAKFLGHGICDTITKSSSLVSAVSDSSFVYREVLKIIEKLKVDSKDLRGIGIQLTKLENNTENTNNGLLKFLDTNKHLSETKSNKMNGCLPTSSKKSITPNLNDMSFSQVDESFLTAMPKDIRDEIIMTFKKDKKNKNDFFSKKEIKPKVVDKSLTIEANERCIENKDLFNNYVSLGELKNLLEEWVNNGENPLPQDITLICNYLKELITTRYIEELSVLLKYFHRFVKSQGSSEKWKQTYFHILNEVQQKMVELYRGKLAVEEQYNRF